MELIKSSPQKLPEFYKARFMVPSIKKTHHSKLDCKLKPLLLWNDQITRNKLFTIDVYRFTATSLTSSFPRRRE